MNRSIAKFAKREFAKPYVFGQKGSVSENVGNLFSPENLDPKELALSANRLVHMEMVTDEISSRYAQRVREVGSQMKSQDIAMTLNALVKMPKNPETAEAVEILVKLVPTRLMHFAPLEISLVLNSLAKLSIKDEKLLKKFAAEIPHKLEIFAEDNFAQTVHALARLGYVNDKLLISDFAEFLKKRIGNFNAQQVFMTANAFGRFARSGNFEVFPIIISKATQLMEALQPHQGPLILTAAAAANFRGPEIDRFATKLSRKISDPRNAGIFLCALAKLDFTNERFGWSRLLDLISDHPPQEIPAVVQLFHALGKRGVSGDCSTKILSKLLNISVLPRLEVFDGNQLAIVVYALGNLNLEISRSIVLRLTNLLNSEAEFSGSALAMLSFSVARDSDRLAHFLTRRLKVPELSAKSLGMALNGFGANFPEKLKADATRAISALAVGGKLTPEEARGLVKGARSATVTVGEDERVVLAELAKNASRRDSILESL